MKRIFIAINLPENIKEKIEKEKIEIQHSFPQGIRNHLIKWVRKENYHLTLLFVGNVPEERLEKIETIVSGIATNQKPFEIKLKTITYAPPRVIPPRLIWLNVEHQKKLQKLALDLKNAFSRENLLRKIENREFSPHITLGRIKTWLWKRIEPEERPEITREIDERFLVSSIELMESHLKRTGAEYFVLKKFPLKNL